jgi:aspartate-semialdehyde dehydrogenase
MPYCVAVVGATGAVGEVMQQCLAERDFPVSQLKLLASPRSVGRTYAFRGERVTVEEVTEHAFAGVDIALFSIPKAHTRRLAPIAAEAGAVVVDNSNTFRMDPLVPLVVPEVNADQIAHHRGIIANPNCSTIQLVVALKPLHDAARVKRVVVTTLQSVSGAGLKAIDELTRQSRELLAGHPYPPNLFPHQIAFNAIPQIPQSDAFDADGYTTEEVKMRNETRKIMGDPRIALTATCVRVPVFYAHSEAVNVEFERPLSAVEARRLLAEAPGVTVVDDPAHQRYPLAVDAAGKDDVFVGRIRDDATAPNALNLWVVSDNLRKGAATNAVQIAEHLVRHGLV